MRKKIEDTLISLGISPSLKGFTYLTKSVEIVLDDDNHRMGMTEIYHMVSDECLTSWRAVERNIRCAVSKVDAELWSKYSGIKKTNNADFVFTLALKIRQEDYK